ncbi:hypothetical protein SLS62_003304 [Diatrype stigma]|uniref:Pleckstrin homology domain-containing protein n=1 Tax=Diatrype stigma TaxID=117547 RepID=A0AAN9YUT8_9PEZI
MAVREIEDELGSVAAAASLPTPSDTPYRTPSRNSRRSRRSITPPAFSSSPPPLPPGHRTEKGTKRSSRDVMMDETISILDPRRFTPTLHANLVSEILALRRDQEDKLKIIESLEESLHNSREEQETLQTNLTNSTKENRSLKRQLTLLEGGTSSALGELARERDEAVETLSETKRRLETSQKKIKTQEEDSQRVHDLWAKERDDWEEERRKYERKLHVAESRVKTVLDEVAAFQATQANGAQDGAQNGAESEEEDAGKEDDVGSVRTMSMTNSVRFSTVLAAGLGKLNGHSLADELNFDDDSDSQTDLDGRQSIISSRHNRNFSRDSMLSRTHGRNVSLDSQIRPGSVRRRTLHMNPGVLDRLQGGISEDDESEEIPVVKVEYTDSAVQYSPPPSPKLAPSEPSTPEPAVRAEKTMEVESPQRGENEIEANQRRKRVQLNKPIAIEPPAVTKVMVSAASQTIDESPSLPMTPISPIDAQPPAIIEEQPSPIEMNSIATQTDDAPVEEPAPQTPPNSQSPLLIPSISIIPPTSRPPSPREHLLPQYAKDFGCQVSIIVPSSGERASISTQTDEIRIDTRLDKLPPHLHPSAISSRPVSPNPTIDTMDDDSTHFTPVPGNLPPRNPRRLTAKRSLTDDLTSSPPASPISQITDTTETHDAYPGNNDDGPLSDEKAPVRRPHRISSLFAGFEPETSEEGEGFEDGDGSDNEFQTALSAPNPKDGAQKRSTIRSSPEQVRMVNNQPASIAKQMGGPEVYSSFSLVEGKVSSPPRAADKPTMTNLKSPANGMRKSAMIQSGIASHQTRSPSPILFENHDPPFPIPARASSRRPAANSSVFSDTQRSPTRGAGDSWHRRSSRGSVYRSNSIRKVRSAAALPPRVRNQRRRSSRSPPPLSPSEEAPDSPSLPPLPSNQITTPRGRDHRYRGHRSQPSTNTAYTDNTNQGSVGSSQQASGVVDAIAQTMVGEWMFKYVRRRKSFGVAEGNADENSGDRHKRWVWLAPYERAILWSSKQPQSGSALMGKSGRKLTIQSVLDVKDDNGPPKGAGQIFNRSILILTPQRALKFTATTAERHYLWLTALSFLAHSQQAVPEILPVAPPALSPGLAPAPKSASATITEFVDVPRHKPPTKKGGIRDSIRLTKGKSAAHSSHHFGGGGGHGGGGGGVGILMEEEAVNADQLDDALATFKPEAFAPPSTLHYSDLSRDAAEPPFIPRFHDRSDRHGGGNGGVHEHANQVVLHGRKRSNTGGHVPPPLSFRGFSSPPTGPSINSSSSHHAPSNSTAGNSVAGNSIGTAGSSDIYSYVGGGGPPSQISGGGGGAGAGPSASTASAAGWGPVGSSIAGSVRTSEASSRPNTNTNSNFFEAIGTVRMEAFISPLTFPRFDDHPDEADEWRYRARRRSKERRRTHTRSRSRRRDSYASRATRATAITATTANTGTDYSSTYGGGRSSRAGTAADEDFFRDRDDPFKGF